MGIKALETERRARSASGRKRGSQKQEHLSKMRSLYGIETTRPPDVPRQELGDTQELAGRATPPATDGDDWSEEDDEGSELYAWAQSLPDGVALSDEDD